MRSTITLNMRASDRSANVECVARASRICNFSRRVIASAKRRGVCRKSAAAAAVLYFIHSITLPYVLHTQSRACAPSADRAHARRSHSRIVRAYVNVNMYTYACWFTIGVASSSYAPAQHRGAGDLGLERLTCDSYKIAYASYVRCSVV